MDMAFAEVTEKIRALLKSYPEGLSITSISSLAGVNRNTLVKYLQVLQSQGSVGMRQIGVAKVYYLAGRIPASAVRRFCRHYIILDHLLDVVETSASIPACLGTPAHERASRRICDQFPGLQGIANFEARLRSALRDEEQTVRWPTGKNPGERVLSVSFIPTVLESGRPAVSLILNDATESSRSIDGDELLQHRVETARPAPARTDEHRESKLRYCGDVARRELIETGSPFARFAVENSTDGICWIDQSGCILYANQAFCESLGYTRDDLRSRYFQDIDAQCDRVSFERMWATLRRDGRYSVRSMLRRLDETLLPVETITKYHKVNGREYCCAYFRVVSGATDEVLQRSKDLFGKALDESPAGLALYDRKGALVHANKVFQKLSGPLPTSGIGLFRHPGLTRKEIDVLQQGHPIRYSRSTPRGEGSQGVMRTETTITPLGGSSKHPPLGYLVWVQKTYGQEDAGNAVRSPGCLLKKVMRDLPEAAFAVDCDGRVIAWNRAMEAMTGISAAEMLGKGNHEYSLPFYRGRVPMLIDRVIGSGTSPGDRYACSIRMEGNCAIAERVFSLPDGYSRVILEKALPIGAGAGRVLGAIEFIHDITALRHTEELLKRERRFNTAVLEAINALILVADDAGRIVWCNERYRAWTGHAGHEPPGRVTHESSGADPGDTGEPFAGSGPVKAGERLPIRWSRRTFVQPGAGRFEIYTGICPTAGEAEGNPYESTE